MSLISRLFSLVQTAIETASEGLYVLVERKRRGGGYKREVEGEGVCDGRGKKGRREGEMEGVGGART